MAGWRWISLDLPMFLPTCSLISCFITLVVGDVFVSPTGSDTSGQGTISNPYATPNKGIEAAVASGDHRVILRGGRYGYGVTVNATGVSNLEIFAYEADSTPPVLSGAIAVQSPWKVSTNPKIPESARGKVYEADVGGVISSLGSIAPPWQVQNQAMHVDVLFQNKSKGWLARWPNKVPGTAEGNYSLIAATSGFSSRLAYVVNGSSIDSPDRWEGLSGFSLHGFFGTWWWDARANVSSVDTASKTITLTENMTRGAGVAKGGGFYGYNLIEELDAPGEYYFANSSTLYIYPPTSTPPTTSDVSLVLLQSSLLTLSSATNVSVKGIVFEGSQGNVGVIDDCVLCSVINCKIQFAGHMGVYVTDGESVVIQNSSIHHTGLEGIVMSGGNRTTLTPSNHLVNNTDIGFPGDFVYTYTPAIEIQGVGASVSYCTMHDGPHQAILFSGNNHRITRCRMERFVLQTYDSGAIYADRDLTVRGTEITENFFASIGIAGSPCNSITSCIRQAIYLDDFLGGTGIARNIFLGPMIHGIFFHNGGWNNVTNNLFLGNGVSFWSSGENTFGSVNSTIYQRLAAVPYTDETWAMEYPHLATILLQRPGPSYPVGNLLSTNVIVNATGPNAWDKAHNVYPTNQGWAATTSHGFSPSECPTCWQFASTNFVSSQPGFANPNPIQNLNFTFAPSSPVWSKGWHPIPPISSMGVQQ